MKLLSAPLRRAGVVGASVRLSSKRVNERLSGRFSDAFQTAKEALAKVLRDTASSGGRVQTQKQLSEGSNLKEPSSSTGNRS